MRTERYWDLHYVPKLRLGSLAAYRERFLEIFRESVRLRLVSDVPLGAFLSGGIDSSAVVALMSPRAPRRCAPSRSASPRPTTTSCATPGWSPSATAPSTTSWSSHPQALEVLPELVRHYGEPFADSSAVPT